MNADDKSLVSGHSADAEGDQCKVARGMQEVLHNTVVEGYRTLSMGGNADDSNAEDPGYVDEEALRLDVPGNC